MAYPELSLERVMVQDSLNQVGKQHTKQQSTFKQYTKVFTTVGRRSSDLPPYQAFTFLWIKIFLKVLICDVCISLNAF